MRIGTKDENIQLVQALPNGEWAVRWNFRPKLDEEGNETGINWYEEEILTWIPYIEALKEFNN